MLKLNASYSKKVPVQGEDFSSQSYHCSMEVELSDKLDGEELQTKIHETFAMVRDAVEAELHGGVPVAKPEMQRPPMRVLRQPEVPARSAAPAARQGGEKATNKQIKYLLDLGKAQGLGLSELNTRAQKGYRAASVYDLTRAQASQFVDELKAAA